MRRPSTQPTTKKVKQGRGQVIVLQPQSATPVCSLQSAVCSRQGNTRIFPFIKFDQVSLKQTKIFKSQLRDALQKLHHYIPMCITVTCYYE